MFFLIKSSLVKLYRDAFLNGEGSLHLVKAFRLSLPNFLMKWTYNNYS